MRIMGHLFLDIESFVDPDNQNSGLNPFYEKSKVIAIAYNYYPNSSAPKPEQIKEPNFIFEWEEGSEKKLLEKFYEFLKEIEKKEFNNGETYLKIIGFNHLAYDLNYLFARMLHHKISKERELFNLLFTQPRHIDLAQIGMAVSKATKRDEDFRTISQKAINSYYEIPVKEANGKEVSLFYSKKEFEKIKKYCKEEFTFELLYQSLLQTFLH
jgi:DNA polymerase elongation subunit (family B)